MDASVITAADALKEGEISSMISVDGKGYYVIRLDSEFDRDATDKELFPSVSPINILKYATATRKKKNGR